MSRTKIPDRRPSVTTRVVHPLSGGKTITALVTYGMDEVQLRLGKYRVMEMFCADFKAGTDQHGLVMDICVVTSKLLQHGYSVQQIMASLSAPASLLGSIVSVAVELENGEVK